MKENINIQQERMEKMHQRHRQLHKITHDRYFSERDCWNLSTVLAKTIAAGLRRFSQMKRHGYPASFLPPERVDPPTDEDAERADREWQSTLKQMLWSFDEIAKNYPSSPWSQWHHIEYQKLEEQGIPAFTKIKTNDDGSVLVKSNIPETPQDVLDKETAYREQIQNGLNLFAKHFENLWD